MKHNRLPAVTEDSSREIGIREVYRQSSRFFRVFAAGCWLIGLLLVMFGLMLFFGGPFEFFGELRRHLIASGGTLRNAVSEVFAWAFIFSFAPVLLLIMWRNVERELRERGRRTDGPK